MPDEITGGVWGLILAVFVLGVAAGIAVAYLWVLRDKRSDVLEHELQKQQSEFERHLEKVDEHFVRTSELFQEMTENYRAVYEHLATGANDLCSDRVVARRMTQIEEPPLVERAGDDGPPAAAGEAGQPEAPAQPASGAGDEERAEAPAQGASGAWDETAEEPARESASAPSESEEAAAEEEEKAGPAGTERDQADIGTGQGRR